MPHRPIDTREPRIRTLIVDDERLAREGIRLQLERHPSFDVVGECDTGRAAIRAIRELRPDLVFLDVQMPGVDGFGVIAEIGAESMPVVVFVTAFDAHAIRAFDAHALDYVLKPIGRERFEQALARARQRVEQDRYGDLGRNLAALSLMGNTPAGVSAARPPAVAPQRRTTDRFLVRSGRSMQVVTAVDIEWIESESDHVRLHIGRSAHVLRMTLTSLEKELDPLTFVRIHRSTIVNVGHIRELQTHANREYIVVLRDGTKLKLSRSYRDRLDSFFRGTF
jgi:two-component system, LytTR family, response regulator